jgi:hypothetical protein
VCASGGVAGPSRSRVGRVGWWGDGDVDVGGFVGGEGGGFADGGSGEGDELIDLGISDAEGARVIDVAAQGARAGCGGCDGEGEIDEVARVIVEGAVAAGPLEALPAFGELSATAGERDAEVRHFRMLAW